MINDAMFDTIELFDLQDKPVGSVECRKRGENDPPRRIVFRGRTFLEGGSEGSFYGVNQAGEVEAAA